MSKCGQRWREENPKVGKLPCQKKERRWLYPDCVGVCVGWLFVVWLCCVGRTLPALVHILATPTHIWSEKWCVMNDGVENE